MIAAISHRRFSAVMVLTALLIPALSVQAGEPVLSQDTHIAGLVAELTECRREEGVMTVRLCFRNTTDREMNIKLINSRDYDTYYATAGNKKYFMLHDSEKNPLAPQADGGGSLRVSLVRGGTYIWWAKYPAPPDEVKKISYYTPLTPPFDNIEIKD